MMRVSVAYCCLAYVHAFVLPTRKIPPVTRPVVPSSTAAVPSPPWHRRPAVLVTSSAWVAAIMSLQAGALAHAGVPTITIAAACGVVASSAASCFGRLPRALSVPIVVQALLGGSMPHLAFYAISKAGLSIANCLMFTMPLWSGAFAALVGGSWRVRDTMVSIASSAGVVLVARPPFLTGGSNELFSLAGCAAALAFGAVGGALNVVLGAPALAGYPPASLTASQMFVCALLAMPALVGLPLSRWLGTASSAVLPALALVGILMALQSSLRTRGLQLAPDVTPATWLYTEIAFCFALDVAFLGARPHFSQYLGAAIIVGAAVANVVVPDRLKAVTS